MKLTGPAHTADGWPKAPRNSRQLIDHPRQIVEMKANRERGACHWTMQRQRSVREMPLIFAVSWTKLSSGSVSVIVVTGRISLCVTATSNKAADAPPREELARRRQRACWRQAVGKGIAIARCRLG
jgi:hypothetical protein